MMYILYTKCKDNQVYIKISDNIVSILNTDVDAIQNA